MWKVSHLRSRYSRLNAFTGVRPVSDCGMPSASSEPLARRNAIKLGAGLVGNVIAQGYASQPCSAAPMAWDEYSRLDGLQMAELVRKGEITASELLDCALHRAETVNPTINAIVETFDERARAAIAKGLPKGPWTGVPLAVKDVSFSMEGELSACGSHLFASHRRRRDSTVIQRYRRAGLVPFARTTTPELGLLPTTESTLSGITRNPWDLSRTVGGSSGGSAATVAAGVTPIATGTDGGGSIRIPSSCCGLFGLKPTRARVPLGPDVFEGWGGLSVAHCLTRSVRDSAALLDVARGAAPGDAYTCPPPERPFLTEVTTLPGKLRIAVVSTMPPTTHVDEECQVALEQTVRLCGELSHQPRDMTAAFGKLFPFDRLREAMGIMVLVETRVRILRRLKQLGRDLQMDDLEPVTRYYFDLAAEYTATQLAESRTVFHQASRVMADFQREYDVVMTPTLALPPISHGRISLQGLARDVLQGILDFMPCTQLANWTGQPAMSVPLHWTRDGLPVGVQFMGRFGDEATLFRLAAQLERAQPWRENRPLL